MEQQEGEVTKSALWLLSSKGFYPIVALFQVFFLIAVGQSLDLQQVIQREVVISYFMLPFMFSYWWQIRAEDIENLKPYFRGNDRGFIEKFISSTKKSLFKFNSVLVQYSYFLMFFILFWFIFFIFHFTGLLGVSQIHPSQAIPVLVYHTLVVAPVETIVFCLILPMKTRAVLEEHTTLDYKARQVVTYGFTCSLFALAHSWVFQWHLGMMGWAFGMGLIFLAITDLFGASATYGAHGSTNGYLSGVLAVGGILGSSS